MSNMSYCRFQNTARDLADCQEALELLFRGESDSTDDDGEPYTLSQDELQAAEQLLSICADLVALIVEEAGVSAEDLFDPFAGRDVVRSLLCAMNTAAEKSRDEFRSRNERS